MSVTVYAILFLTGVLTLAVQFVLLLVGTLARWTAPADEADAPAYQPSVFPGWSGAARSRAAGRLDVRAPWLIPIAAAMTLAGGAGLVALVVRQPAGAQVLIAAAGGVLGYLASGAILWGVGRRPSPAHPAGGAVVDLRKAVGQVAEVIAPVPARGEPRGRVRVDLDRGPIEVTAVSETGVPIGRGARVRIMRVGEIGTVVVSPLPESPLTWDSATPRAETLRTE